MAWIDLLVTYHVSAYRNEGSFEEDAELCERTGGKAVFLKGSSVLWRRSVRART